MLNIQIDLRVFKKIMIKVQGNSNLFSFDICRIEIDVPNKDKLEHKVRRHLSFEWLDRKCGIQRISVFVPLHRRPFPPWKILKNDIKSPLVQKVYKNDATVKLTLMDWNVGRP